MVPISSTGSFSPLLKKCGADAKDCPLFKAYYELGCMLYR